MRSNVEALEGNRVKVTVAVPADEFDGALDVAFRKLAREVRIPGFRPGKAPRRLLEAQLGSGVAREQALRDSVPEYLARAVTEHEVDVIAFPEVEITSGADTGDVEFEAVVEVRPVVTLEGYDGLQVEVPFEAVADDAVDAQVDRLREQFADLEASEEPVVDGTYVTVDVRGTRDGEDLEGLVASDYLYEVGSAAVVDELDEQLRGTRPGAILRFESELPERFGERAGETVEFSVVVKDVQRKVLPDLSDEWVRDASELETVEELRADVRRRLETVAHAQARMLVRDRVLEAIADLVPVAAPDSMVDQELERRVRDLAQRLSQQGATIEAYLEATGTPQEQFLAELREGATRAVLADLALRAVVAQEGLTVGDDELDVEIARLVERTGEDAVRVRRELERGGGIEALRSDLARQQALEHLVGRASVVDESGAPVDLAPPAAGAEPSAEPASTTTDDDPDDRPPDHGDQSPEE